MLAPRLQRMLYLALLSSKHEKVEFRIISRTTGVSHEVIKAWLRSSGIETDGKFMFLKEKTWTALAEGAVNKGVPLEVIANTIPWQRFEILVKEALVRYGFETRRHVRYKSCGRRWEIDVLGVREGDLICIDCKQWKRGSKGSALRKSAREQLSRVVALSQLPTKPKFLRTQRNKLTAYTALTTLLDTGLYVVDGCFIIPITKLNSFLDQFYELRGLARSVRVEQECFAKPQ